MEEQREESGLVGDCRESMEEAGKGLGLSSKTETLAGEDATTVEVSDSGVCYVSGKDGNLNGGSATEDGKTDNSVSNEKQVKVYVRSVEVEQVDEKEGSELCNDVQRVSNTVNLVDVEMNDEKVKSEDGASHESAGEDETVTSAGNEVTDEKVKCEEDNGGAYDAEQNVQIEKSQKSSVDGETLSVAEYKDEQEKESTKKREEDNNEMGADIEQEKGENVSRNKQGNHGYETTDAKHSESAQVPEEPTQLSKGETNEENPGTVSEVSSAAEICCEEEITNIHQKEENGEAMEIDYAADEQVEKDVTVGGVLDNADNESADVSMIQTQDVPIAETDRNNSNMASDLTGTIESADSENPNSPTEDVAPGEVEPLDHNALFDPSSDITNFIDFSGVSSWSGNIQNLKTDTRIASLKDDKKATDTQEEVATVDHNETVKSVGATVNTEPRDEPNEARVATDCPKEAFDEILGSVENQEDKDHQCLDQKTVDQQDTMREEDDTTHEAPTIDPNQKEDTEMEANPNDSDADVGADSDIKTNGVKRKADVLSEDSPGEGRKTVSLAKVSFVQKASFKIGACIARAASQMAGSPSILKGSNFGDETLSVESFVSQLHFAATDPVKKNVVSEIATGFFLDYRNSSVLQQVPPEKISSKRGRPSNSTAGGTEAFEFEEMGDTYWTDRVIHNGGEEQTPPTEKGNYQVVPVELKPAQVRRTRRPYRRRQSHISTPLPSASDKPADLDENAPAELIMKFSEPDTIPLEKSLSKMFRHFGPIRESQTEVDSENNRARVVFRKGADAEIAYNSAGRFNIFGTKAVNYELSYTITETFKVQPYVVSLGEEEATLSLPS